jgi:hypothetical protein
MPVCLILLPSLALAQQPVGTIAGTVTDGSGAVVAGATVTIVQSASQFTIRKTTTVEGTFDVPGLPPGTFDVRVDAPRFKPARIDVTVEVGRATTVAIRLEVGQVAETVTVASNALRVNTRQVTLDGIVTEGLIKGLPLNGRNLLDLGQLEPGVQATRDDSTTREGFARLAISGQTGLSTRVSIDGVDTHDEFGGGVAMNLSPDAIGQFQVSRALFDISTGLSGSGAVNVVTKSGGNEWRGDAILLWRGDTVPAFNGQPALPFDRTQAGASLGGRLMRDRLFMFGDYEGNDQAAATVTIMPVFPQFSRAWSIPSTQRLATLRFDANITPTIRAFVRGAANAYAGISSKGLGGTKLAPFETSQRAYQMVAGVDLIRGAVMHSLRGGYTRLRLTSDIALGQYPEMPPPVDPEGRLVALLEGGTQPQSSIGILIGAYPNSPIHREQTAAEIRYDGTFSRGAHALRWGADVNLIDIYYFETLHGHGPQLTFTYNDKSISDCGSDLLCYPVQNVAVGNGQGYRSDVPSHGYPYGGAKNHRVHAYAGDTWRLHPRVTATLGLRWVYEPGPANPDVERPAILDTFQPGLSGPDRRDFNNFAPQAGLAWTPTDSGRWVVRAGAGVFYDMNRLQNVIFTERHKMMAPGISDVPQAGLVLHPDTREVIFDLLGRYPTAWVTPGKNWRGKSLDEPGLLQAVFQAQAFYRAATQELAAVYPSGPTECERSRTCTFLAPDYPTPFSRQFIAGFQHEIRDGLVLSVDYVRHDNRNFMMRHNLNRNGAADTLDYGRAVAAMNAVQLQRGCAAGAAGVDCAIGKGVLINTYVDAGLGSSATASARETSNAAFPGTNPLFNAMWQLEMNGKSTYNALHVNVRGTLPDAGRVLKSPIVVASYALSRLEGTAEDQSALNVSDRMDNDDMNSFYGPTGLDRTHMLSVAALVTLPGDVRINSVWKAFTALPQTLVARQMIGPGGGEIFATDFNGDGTAQDVLPGTNRGGYGRSLGCGATAVNRVIDAFNASQAGRPTPAGRALINAGLFTEPQLKSLGAVSQTIAFAPEDQVCLDAFYSTDIRISRVFMLNGGRVTIEPAIEVFNVFNASNYDLPENKLTGTLNGQPGSLNGTTPANRTNRAGTMGSFTPGAPRSWQLGVRVSF